MAGAVSVPQPVSSWGRLTHEPHRVLAIRERAIPPGAACGSPSLAYGNGRSYGDVGLNPGGLLWMMRGLDRFISFDAETGVIDCEAGVLLRDIVAAALPRGWFLPVTPGTQFATLGGAIANDVHGKNHHRAGSLGEHVESLELARTDGSVRRCGPGIAAEWFAATVGGLGLTGVIVSARLRLKRVPGAWLDTQTHCFDSLHEFFALSRQSETAAEYAVAWVDCVGGRGGQTRGVFFSANHAEQNEASPARPTRSLPVTPPVSLVNGLSLRVFNAAYLFAHRHRAAAGRQHIEPFFYPLDALRGWNRLYGPRGFYQYQCVVPKRDEAAATAALLAAIRQSGEGSFLAVLKTFGERSSPGLLSFPMPGVTLALDFPNRGERTHRLFERLDAIVADAGGRIYPAKDARMSRSLFEQGYPRLADFQRFRDPGISSAMSRRLMGA